MESRSFAPEPDGRSFTLGDLSQLRKALARFRGVHNICSNRNRLAQKLYSTSVPMIAYGASVLLDPPGYFFVGAVTVLCSNSFQTRDEAEYSLFSWRTIRTSLCACRTSVAQEAHDFILSRARASRYIAHIGRCPLLDAPTATRFWARNTTTSLAS